MAGEMIFCRGCGKQIGADVKFCKYCGFRFDAPKQEAATPQSIQDKMKASLDAGRQKNAAEQSASPAGAPTLEQQSFKDRMRASFEAGKAKGQAFGDRVVGKSAPEPPQQPAVTPAQPAQAPQSSENAPAAKFCRQCGNTVSATAQFCGKCGFRFDTPAQPVSQAQQPVQQSADSFARNRRGGIKHSPIGASARQNLQRAMPSGAKVRKTSKGVLAAVLAFAMLLTGFGWPGWIRNLFDRPNTPPAGYYGGNTTGGGTVGSVPLSVQSLASPLEVGYLDGVGEGVGGESTFVDTPVVSRQTLSVPEDGAAVTADCGAAVELGAHNAIFARELTVTQHEPDTQTIPGGRRVYYDIDAGETHEFDYYFDITLPYDPAGTEPGREEATVFAEYLNEESGEWEPVMYDVDTANHQLIVHTNHLSGYSAVTVESSDNVYAQLVKLGNVYLTDEAAMKDLTDRMAGANAELKLDPVAAAFVYQMAFTATENLTFGMISHSDVENAVQNLFGGTDGVFNDIVGWVTSFGYDMGSYLEIIPSSTTEWANAASRSYLPGQLCEIAGNFATFVSAACLAEKVCTEMEQNQGDPSRGTIMDLYKWLAMYQFSMVLSKLGVVVGSVVALPVTLVDYSLIKIAQRVQDAEDDALSKALYAHYNLYFARPMMSKQEKPKVSDISGFPLTGKDAGVQVESWETRLLKVQQNNMKQYRGDPDQLSATINSALLADMTRACNDLRARAQNGDGDMEIAIAEGVPANERRNLWSTLKDIDEDRSQVIIDKAVALLIKDLQPVFLELAKHQRTELRAQATAWTGVMEKALNTKHTLIIEEKYPGDGESVYAGCQVRFVHHKRTVPDALWDPTNRDPRIVEWKGRLDDHGGMTLVFNTFGYIRAGVPDKVQIYAPNADMDKDKPLVEVDFEIRQKTTKVVLGDLPFVWFEGLWKWEDRHDPNAPFDDEAFELTVLAADTTHAYFRQVDIWGDGAMNLCTAEYDVFEDRLTLRDVGSGEAMLVMTAKNREPDRVAVNGLYAGDELIMERAQESDAWWNDRRLERDQLVQMAVEQGYMTRQGGT